MRRLALKLAVTIIVVAIVLQSIDGAQVVKALGTADVSLVVLAAMCTVVLNALRALRWLWLLKGEAPNMTYRDALWSHLFATGARLVVPGQLGELGKALAVDVDLARSTGLAGVDVALEVSTTLLVAAVGAALIFGPGPIVLAFLGGSGLLWLAAIAARWLSRTSRFRWPSGLVAAWSAGRAVPRLALVKGFVLSLGLHGLRLLQLVLLIASLGATPSFLAVASLPFVQLADAFSFTVGRVGVREWMGSAILPSFGLTAEVGVTAVFLQTMISNILPGVVGIAVMYSSRRTAFARLRLMGAR